MPYSVMIWLVDREHVPSGLETRENRHDPVLTPGAAAGVTAGPAFDRLNYGFYEDEDDAKAAMMEIAKDLEKNNPLKVKSGSRTFLIPASRVHYIVSEEVTRPKDEPAEAHAHAGLAHATA
jgi:DNA-binding LytR/AlgR family response regulator